MGRILAAKGDYDAAISNLQQSLHIWQSALGRKHLDTAQANHIMGRILAGKREYQKALGHIQKTMGVREALLGKNHTGMAISYATMASVILLSKKKGYHQDTLESKANKTGLAHGC